MTEHICKVFRSPIGCIYIAEESLIEWIIKFQPTLRNVWVKKNVITSVEALDRILKNLKVTGCFHLDSIAVDENFQYTEPIPFRFIAINNAYWVSSSSILNGNNSIIRLSGSKLAPKDINTMLKKWQMGTKLRKLEFLEVRISTPLDIETFAAAFKDLDGTLSDGNDGRPNTVSKVENKFEKESESKHGFPLLNLPRVVLLEFIENLDVLEIIVLSLLSKRAKAVAKLVRWNSLNILLQANSKPVIQLKCSINPGRIWKMVYEKKDAWSEYLYVKSILAGPRVFYRLTLRDHENAIEDSKQMAEHICEVFRSPISSIYTSEDSLIEWLIKFQPTIRYVSIRKNVVTSVETLDRILNNLKVTEHFWLESITIDENFQYSGPIPSRSITINDSSWVTLPSIINGNNSVIRLFGSKLTPTDINTIFKEWQMGTKLQNLEYLEINTPAIDAFTRQDVDNYTVELLKDLRLTESDGNEGRPMEVEIHNENLLKLPQENRVFNLTRSDGMIGSLFGTCKINERKNYTIMHTYFQVWKKQV
ncbi:unnamed protein product [Caenorhabditis nigoni]